MEKKVVGIIGGMGPLATVDLFRKIVVNTKAACDGEHIRILVDNNTNIPDRTKAILAGGANPVRELTSSACKLEEMGADFLIMPCNTAHYFHEEVQRAVSIPVLNMIRITCDSLIKQGIKKAGLLATDGTIKSGIYHKVFEDSGVELIQPEDDEQSAIMDMIYSGVKAGRSDYDASKANCVMARLVDRGAQALILGCTELPLAMGMYNLSYPSVDPTLELAMEAIRTAGARPLN